jgi:hypothetical protein
VNSPCDQVAELLVEVQGALDRLPPEARRHASSCTVCAANAATERRLAGVLESVLPPSDPALEARVLARLQARRVRRSLLAALPVAASLAVVATGAVLAGGLPGSRLLGQVPMVAGHGWLHLLGAASDWSVALLAVSRTIGTALPAFMPVAGSAVALLGLASVVLAVRRWRPGEAWRRDD